MERRKKFTYKITSLFYMDATQEEPARSDAYGRGVEKDTCFGALPRDVTLLAPPRAYQSGSS